MRKKIAEEMKDIARISGLPTKLIYAAFSAAAFVVTAGIGTLIIGVAILIGSVMGFIEIKNANATQPKTDPCLIYQKKAKRYLTRAESRTRNPVGYYGYVADFASMSAAYSSYYLVCRDLERQR